jgi:hypothetical protein
VEFIYIWFVVLPGDATHLPVTTTEYPLTDIQQNGISQTLQNLFPQATVGYRMVPKFPVCFDWDENAHVGGYVNAHTGNKV